MNKRSLHSLLAAGTLVGVLGFSEVVMATPSHGQPGKRIEMLKEKLNLSDEQANKIAEIVAQGRGECRSYEERAERRSCWKRSAESKRDQIKALLSPEQQAQFAELRAKRMERRMARKERCGK